MIEITEQNFGRIVKRSNKSVIVSFAGEWCPDCNALTPLYQRLEEKYKQELVFGRAFEFSDEQVGVSQPAISITLDKLCDFGLVKETEEGYENQWRCSLRHP